MNFRRYRILPVIFLLAVLLIQPALSAGNITEFITGKNVTSVTNYTSDLDKDPGIQFYNYGVQSVEIKDYTHAIDFFDQALIQNLSMLKMTDSLLYIYQGKSYAQIKLQNFTGAVATADAGLALYPKDPMLWNNKGWALQTLGKNEDALTAYNKAVSLDGNYTNALINQGNLSRIMGRNKEAITAFTKANETDPFNVAASDGLDAAKKAEAESSRTMSILMGIILVAVIGIVIWYVKFRKPAEQEPQGKKKKSGKK